MGLGREKRSLRFPGRRALTHHPPPLLERCRSGRTINNRPSTASTIFPTGSAGARGPLLPSLAVSFGPEEVFIGHGSSLPAAKGENYTRVRVFVAVTALGPAARFREASEMAPAPTAPQPPAEGWQREAAPGEGLCLLPHCSTSSQAGGPSCAWLPPQEHSPCPWTPPLCPRTPCKPPALLQRCLSPLPPQRRGSGIFFMPLTHQRRPRRGGG